MYPEQDEYPEKDSQDEKVRDTMLRLIHLECGALD
jgi:hypothetical protein